MPHASPRLKRLRIAAGVKPKTFAKALGITPGYLSHVEGQRASASEELLNAIAKKLGVEVGVLIADEDSGTADGTTPQAGPKAGAA